MLDKKNNYWNKFYKSLKITDKHRMPPSQFASFCRIEMMNLKINEVVEIASGDGRDAIFFAQEGINVYASDKSSSAINLLKKNTSHLKNINIKKIDITKGVFQKRSVSKIACAYYARFFLHVLNETELKKFFKTLSKNMKINDYFFTEYRNEKDKTLKKVTEKHFRKFYNPDFISSVARKNNLRCIYEVEGRGFAKWKEDDAFVSRQIYIKDKSL